MTVTPVVMPRLGLTMEEGTVVGWLKAEGDLITKGEDLFEVEIDKGTVVAEAPASGLLRALRAQPGEVVPVGQPVAYIADAMDEPLGDGSPAGPAVAEPRPQAAPTVPGSPERAPSREIRAAPAARRRAAELGVDLSSVSGTGPGGRITSEDVERAAQAASSQAPAPAGAPASVAGSLPLSRTRLTVADLMTQSQQSVPQFAVRASVDATALVAARSGATHVSPVDLIVRACALALKTYPEANASFQRVSPDTAQLVLYPQINIGLAVATDAGLVVPVIPNADQLSVAQIAEARRAAVARARSGRLTPADLAETALTISNLGPFGTEDFTAMVIPPQAAILAVGAIKDRPVVRQGRIDVAPQLSLSLSVDHRILDGAAASQLLSAIVRHLEATPKEHLS